jgi:tripartite-type tricarboxylate transporter receptor subunit TctC
MRSIRQPAGFSVALITACVLFTQSLCAQTWPQRTVRFLLPLGAGSATDIGARLLADRLSARWGQPVVIENRPGGDGVVAISGFVGAHDDHVLLYAPSSSFIAHPYLHENLAYKPSDLAPIARVSNTVIAISAPAALNVGNLADLFAMARARPGQLNWAGITSAHDFVFAAFLHRAGLNMTKVPYRNPVEAANDLAEGRVQALQAAFAIIRPQLEAGKIKLLAISTGARVATAPDVPTVTEGGFPDLVIDGLVGLFGPPDMPLSLRQRIADDIRVVADSTVESKLIATGQIMNLGGPVEFGSAIDEQRARLARLAKELGVKPTQ